MKTYYPVKEGEKHKLFGIMNIPPFYTMNYQILDENGQNIIRRFSKEDLARRFLNKISLDELEGGELKRKNPLYDYNSSKNRLKVFPLGRLEFFLFKKSIQKLSKN